MDSIKQINLRFLAQGMVKLKPQDLPPDYAAMTITQLLDWADGYLNDLGRDGLLQAVAYLDIEDDTR